MENIFLYDHWPLDYHPLLLSSYSSFAPSLIYLLTYYFRERKRERERGGVGGAETEGESQADSALSAGP